MISYRLLRSSNLVPMISYRSQVIHYTLYTIHSCPPTRVTRLRFYFWEEYADYIKEAGGRSRLLHRGPPSVYSDQRALFLTSYSLSPRFELGISRMVSVLVNQQYTAEVPTHCQYAKHYGKRKTAKKNISALKRNAPSERGMMKNWDISTVESRRTTEQAEAVEIECRPND
ncbi:Uncharacterized protein APZ42_034577 [Daphnia magna]|uniref:Uncharacterized protein n=1 Tax=Daphnia magna TaxID=35525 RepID=A0A164K0S3_9CRUS|nr:Uncharacterized protein APZ42_034577 [Daphnia magna]